MKRIFALLLAAMMVMSLAACGGNNNESTDLQVSGNTYVFESMTENGEAVAEDMSALYAGSKYVFNSDGTCVYAMSMFGMDIETNGTYTQNGTTVTITLDYGEEGTVEMAFQVSGDTITFTEEIDGTTSAQTYKKEA